MVRDADVVVAGAGVVGLAIAAALARAGRSVLILEKEGGIARGVTSRNSQVVHAGLYYPPASLKARLCCEGRERLYAHCAERRVAHRKLGKLVVAAEPSELPRLEALLANGRKNGAPDLCLIDGEEAARREPALRVVAALVSPASGIVDAHGLALSFLAEAEECGAQLLLHHALVSLAPVAAGWRVEVRSADGESAKLLTGAVVNAAGLDADHVAQLAGLDPDAQALRLRYCKGDYFGLAPGAALQLERLVYPLPGDGGLGIHATLDLDAHIRFGPDTEWIDAPRYDVDPAKASSFAAALRRYLPAMREEWLVPDSAGVRPKLHGPGEPPADFVVREESAAGCPGLVNCIGIESPGLTAAPAIAERVKTLLESV